ncbi:molybdopterin molybdotransferase MoeA [Paraglaciecola aquimarina]|uniref:Molybdopterin molybdenumtransferase n=1 Tax=Paraglaciecola aquimarina TaxID=1235557 RepID=A0ABU3SWQ7_9ALTE|nr:molybdopterin molybdotransferase MoeA [Paraglaciecola aquimarina]MDU0354441.1 molybdopterin molybdotransferase MoeA [Paraglaciecola aquimarina]
MIQTCDTTSLKPITQALTAMLSEVSALTHFEKVNLISAHGRVLAVDLQSGINVPPADNSAMDGYALRCEDLADTDTLKLVGTALAGQPFTERVNAGECVRIMTGAVIPNGADSVVMQENTEASAKTVTFKQIPNRGNSVRKAGEDIQIGQIVVAKGTKLTAAHLALIASVGIAEVEVTSKLTVGLIATGDELTAPYYDLAP